MAAESDLLVVGAGAKAAGIAAKVHAFNSLGLGPVSLKIVEGTEVAASWKGRNGMTSGEEPLAVTPIKDVGFPYQSFREFGEAGEAIDEQAIQFSWQRYMVARRRYARWIDAGSPQVRHRDYGEYLTWVLSRATKGVRHVEGRAYEEIVGKYPKLGHPNRVNHLGTLGTGNHFITDVAAGGITLAFGATLAAVKLRELLQASRRVDDQLARAQARLGTLIAREADERSAELERKLARARADSISQLAEQERRMAEERRTAAAERSRAAGDELGEALTVAQQQVQARLAAWRDDLERAQHAVGDQLAALAQRQKQLISEAEARIATDAERLEAESEQQGAALVRLRDEVARATQETVQSGNTELETYASERRQALNELNERIRRRERQLGELIEREESEAVRRIETNFADVERRQIEHLERILTRATSSYSDAATQEFADAIKAARENAGTRLSRELDRAVQAFAREAQSVLADRLAKVGDTGAQRLEKRMAQAGEGLERHRVEAVAEFEARLMNAEQELRRRLDGLAADTEAERAVLEARLRELARRIDETLART